jgi:putative PIN family toxin of toxin-antitoxin system
MLRVVLDTNILVSAVLSKSGIPAQIVDAWQADEFFLVSYETAIAEVERVLKDLLSLGKYRITEEDISSLLHLLQSDALLVLDLPNVTDIIPAHPADELFLSIALAGESQVIVSGDKHLLGLKTFRGIEILTARKFFDALNADK